MAKSKNKNKKHAHIESDDEEVEAPKIGLSKSQKRKRKNEIKKNKAEMARVTHSQTNEFDDQLLQWEGEDQEIKAQRKKKLKGVKRVKLNTHNMSIKRSKKAVNHLFYNPKN